MGNVDHGPVLIILGGLGPLASSYFHSLVLTKCVQVYQPSVDQEFPSVLHVSFPSRIAPRSEYLLGNVSVNPGIEAAKVIIPYLKSCVEVGCSDIFVTIPCNTFHHEVIYERFVTDTRHFWDSFNGHNSGTLRIFNIVTETISFLGSIFQDLKDVGGKNIGILGTIGTISFKVYQSALEKHGYQVLTPDDKNQVLVDNMINDVKSGCDLSSLLPVGEAQAQLLIDRGADAIILGCTEIPLVLREDSINSCHFINTMKALAESAVMAMHKSVNNK